VVNNSESARIEVPSARFSVSTMTILNDLSHLKNKKVIVRTHGSF